MLQLSRSNVNSVVRSYLSPTPVGVGVGTSLTRAVDQILLPARVWLRETRCLVLSLCSSAETVEGRFDNRLRIMYFRTSFPVPSLKHLAARFCTIGKLQDPAAACLIFVVVAASGAEGCR